MGGGRISHLFTASVMEVRVHPAGSSKSRPQCGSAGAVSFEKRALEVWVPMSSHFSSLPHLPPLLKKQQLDLLSRSSRLWWGGLPALSRHQGRSALRTCVLRATRYVDDHEKSSKCTGDEGVFSSSWNGSLEYPFLPLIPDLNHGAVF